MSCQLKQVAFALFVLALVIGCAPEPPTGSHPPISPADTSSGGANGELRVFGALRPMMHDGAVGANVALSDLLPDRTLYAVGALTDLKGELTVVDGDAFLSVPAGDGSVATTRIRSDPNADQLASDRSSDASATLAVAASVSAWEPHVLATAVTFDELDEAIATLLDSTGRGRNTESPFLIRGDVEALAWHVIDGSRLPPGPSSHHAHQEAALRFERDRTPATLIGFYSQEAAGVFTHMGSWTHVHAVVTDPRRIGACRPCAASRRDAGAAAAALSRASLARARDKLQVAGSSLATVISEPGGGEAGGAPGFDDFRDSRRAKIATAANTRNRICPKTCTTATDAAAVPISSLLAPSWAAVIIQLVNITDPNCTAMWTAKAAIASNDTVGCFGKRISAQTMMSSDTSSTGIAVTSLVSAVMSSTVR